MITITRHMTREWGAEEAFDRWVASVTGTEKAFRRIDMVAEGEVVIHWSDCGCSSTRADRYLVLTMPPIPREAMAAIMRPSEPVEVPSVRDLNPGYE